MFSSVRRYALMASVAAGSAMTGISTAFAQFGGSIPSIPGTPDPGVGGEGVRDAIISILRYVLTFLALVAVIVIVIAGIRLIVSQGEEEAKEKAKKTILYAIIGLIVVLFARVIVALVTEELPNAL